MKPLARKAYGSIPHLLNSRLGPGDHHIHEGQDRICTEKIPDKDYLIIVQEKYDGSCVAVAKVDGEIVALTRSGYTAESSPYEQHHAFARWVEKNRGRFDEVLKPGERVCGEWLLQAHGIRYEIENEPFVAFDVFTPGNERLLFSDFLGRVSIVFNHPRTLWWAKKSAPIAEMMQELPKPHVYPIKAHGTPEGLIYRVEKKDRVLFLAKYVRPDFVPGVYLPDVSGKEPVFNFSIDNL